MTEEVPNECENAFVVAPPAAALPPTAVRCWCDTPLTPPLSLGAHCAPRERTGLTHAAPPALDSGRGWCSVASGCIFERGVMTEEVPNECENVFCCRSACGSAPAYGSEVLVCYSAYPALIPRRTLCASGTDGANSAAPPALGSGRGWCSVASGCIFERDTETRRNPKNIYRGSTRMNADQAKNSPLINTDETDFSL